MNACAPVPHVTFATSEDPLKSRERTIPRCNQFASLHRQDEFKMGKSSVRKGRLVGVFYFGLVLVLAGGLSNFLREYLANNPHSSQAGRSPVGRDAAQEVEEVFVWSDELRDWSLGKQEADQPARSGDDCLWPEDLNDGRCAGSDRIVNQLRIKRAHPNRFFKISIAGDRSLPVGQKLFADDKCLVNKCLITHTPNDADLVVFPNSDVEPAISEARRANQIWVAYFLESPPNTFDRRFVRKARGHHAFNWTASYRSDSDIVTPYAKFTHYLRNVTSRSEADKPIQPRLIGNKQSKVAWFVSNCHAKNGRLEYAQELAKHIQVDIYGKCGNLTCDKWAQDECLRLVNRDYKFYLSFENSNSRQYITEKLYRNALGYNDDSHLLVPIVMGPPKSDYEARAPTGSFIHVDDFLSAKDLASYLRRLGEDSQAYNSYFKWKKSGRFIDTKFMCRLCAMLHESHRIQRLKSIPDIMDWWLTE